MAVVYSGSISRTGFMNILNKIRRRLVWEGGGGGERGGEGERGGREKGGEGERREGERRGGGRGGGGREGASVDC